MPITEKRVGPGPTAGSFSVTLDSPPRRVLDTLEDYPLSFLVVMPTHHPTHALESATAGLGQAVYVGVIQSLDRNQATLTGAGLPVLLGDQDGKGDLLFEGTTGSQDIEWHFDAHLASRLNGLSKGTVGGDATTFPITYRAGSTVRDALTSLCDATDAEYEWRIDPTDLTVDVDTPANLFTQDSVILTADSGGRDGSITGVRAAIELDEHDWSDLTSAVTVDWNSGSNNGTATNGVWNNATGPDGSVLVTEQYTTNQFRPPKPKADAPGWAHAVWQIAGQTEANELASTIIDRYKNVRVAVSIEIDEYEPTRWLVPGDTIYVYEPLLGLIDTTNQIQFRGEVTFPESVRVMGTTRPIQEGMGVYHFRWDSGLSTMRYDTDLTEYVAFETGTTKIEVGALSRTLTA